MYSSSFSASKYSHIRRLLDNTATRALAVHRLDFPCETHSAPVFGAGKVHFFNSISPQIPNFAAKARVSFKAPPCLRTRRKGADKQFGPQILVVSENFTPMEPRAFSPTAGILS